MDVQAHHRAKDRLIVAHIIFVLFVFVVLMVANAVDDSACRAAVTIQGHAACRLHLDAGGPAEARGYLATHQGA